MQCLGHALAEAEHIAQPNLLEQQGSHSYGCHN